MPDDATARVTALLRRLFGEKFYGEVTIKFQAGQPTHVEERRMHLVRNLPDDSIPSVPSIDPGK